MAKKVYYAHCMALYKTPQEARDIAMLESLGFEVINPSSPEVEAVMETLPTSEARMAYFEKFADECDAVAFRALPGTAIPSGVAKEIGWFQERDKPVIELPTFSLRQVQEFLETKLYLREVGQR